MVDAEPPVEKSRRACGEHGTALRRGKALAGDVRRPMARLVSAAQSGPGPGPGSGSVGDSARGHPCSPPGAHGSRDPRRGPYHQAGGARPAPGVAPASRWLPLVLSLFPVIGHHCSKSAL